MWWNSASCLSGSDWFICVAVMFLIAILLFCICFFFRKRMGMLCCCGSNSRSRCGDFSKLDTKDNEDIYRQDNK